MAETVSTSISLRTFHRASMSSYISANVDEILSKVDRDVCTWIHVANADLAVSTRILEHFGLPGVLAEGLQGSTPLELDTSSDRYVLKKFRFIEERVESATGVPEQHTTNLLIRGSETDRLTESSGSMLVGEKFLLLFEDTRPSPLVASAVAAVLRNEREIRERGIEYLMYRLAKGLFIDNYFALMRQLLDRLQDLEATLLEGSTDTAIYREVAQLRRELNPFERSLMYLAEFTGAVGGERPGALSAAGLGYLTETLRSEVNRLESEFAMLRERTSELIQLYRDNINTQLNNVMRALTALSAMFLPLSFITSFYGMNFPNMPALRWNGSFPIVLGVMFCIVVGSLIYARRHKWI